MASSTKDTVYIDVDEEITGIIDKLISSNHKIVALVLPKRAAVLQSIVNMKLLKRTAIQNKKNLVLITSEAGLLPLAGAVGIHVAKTPLSKPYIPAAPEMPDDASEAFVSAASLEVTDGNLDKTQPVGELAGLPSDAQDETIDIDNSDVPLVPTDKNSGATKKSKKFSIPNFERFRKRLFIGAAALVVMIVGLVFILVILPKAKITIKTDTSTIDNSVEFTASVDAKEFDPAGTVLPAQLEQTEKTEAEKVPATGEKDVGTKATGTVTFINCTDEEVTIPTGTAVSSNNLSFITQSGVDLDEGEFTSSAECKSEGDHIGNTKVAAQKNGDQYNLGSRSYNIAGIGGDVRARGSDMSGGTSKIVKIVTDEDIASARAKIEERTANSAGQEVERTLTDAGFFPLIKTLTTGEPSITASPTAGQEGAEVTVTVIRAYSMLGVKKDHLKRLIEESAKKKIGDNAQTIQDDGLDGAVFEVTDRQASGGASLLVKAQTIAGPVLDVESIKKDVAGKKRGEVQAAIKGKSGVSDVSVDYSPFWVLSTPSRTGNITVIVEQSNEEPEE